MSMSLTDFLQQLIDCRAVSAAELKSALGDLPSEQRPRSAPEAAEILIRKKLLTAWQAQTIYQGQAQMLVLGNYLVLDKIGQGGMGVVYKARHRRMDRTVAIKIVSPDAVKSRELVDRFQREVKAAARLSHPNIVTAYDADEVDGRHFLVMEYVDGADAGAMVRKGGPVAPAMAIDYCLQTARGLEYAHRHGVVHRDIKPSNLLIDRDGAVKILDMGLARLDEFASEESVLTSTGVVMGTVDYMAPEQALSSRTADGRADQYSLGCTLYYMLTARHLYEGDSTLEKLLRHREAPIPALPHSRFDIHPMLDATFRRMVAKTPAERYVSMTEVIHALERLSRSDAPEPHRAAISSDDSRFNDFLARMSSTPAAPMAKSGAKAAKAKASAAASSAPAAEEVTLWTEGDSDASPMLEPTVSMTEPQSATVPDQEPLAAPAAASAPIASAAPARAFPPPALLLCGAGVVVALGLAILGVIAFWPGPKTGELVLETDPQLAGAVATIDGQQRLILKAARRQPPIRISKADKSHQLEITKLGYETFRQELHVGAGKQQSLPVEMTPLGPSTDAASADGNFALEFDGKTSRIAIPSLTWEELADNPRQPLTIEALITPRPQITKEAGALVIHRPPLAVVRVARDGKDRFVFSAESEQGTSFASQSAELRINKPQHLACIYDGKGLHLFLNGRRVSQGEAPRLPPPTEGDAQAADGEASAVEGETPAAEGEAVAEGFELPVRFSIWRTSIAAGDGDRDFFQGVIDEIRISSTVRYSEDFTSPRRLEADKDTIALYHCDEGKGDVLHDASANRHHGQLRGVKWVAGKTP